MSSNFTFPTVKPPLSSPRAESLVFHVVLFLLGIIALLLLLRLPRALVRFWTPSEWLAGHFLWYTSYRPSSGRKPARPLPSNHPLEYEYASKQIKGASTDDSHTLYSHTITGEKANRGIVVSFPPHFATCPRFLRQLVTMHRVRFGPGFSVSQVLVMLFYFTIMVYATFYKSSPFTDPVRTGWIAAAQLPFVFALATKNNILGILLGFTYEKLNYLHRFIGRLVVLAANIHSLGYIYKWSLQGRLQQQASRPATIWAFVGLAALDFMLLFSLSFWRARFHNIMVPTHVIGISILIPSVWLHMPSIVPWLCACLGIYGLDHVLRVLKTRVVTATLRALPEMGTTRIEVPNLNGGWRAGQHVRIRILSFGMGWFGWNEVHPFTIASAPGDEEGLVLMAKKAGRWTGRLYEMANGGVKYTGHGRKVQIMIEGPYGGPGHAIFASYSAAVFVAGGSGITFALSAIQDLIRQDLAGSSRVKYICLTWIVQDPDSLHPLLPRFVSMIQESVYTPVHISVHYTRAPLKAFTPPSSQTGITLSPGRPRLVKALETALGRAVTLGADVRAKDEGRVSGILVGVCGPAALGDDVSKAVAAIDPARRDQVGGIEMHEEVFGL